MSSPVLVPKSSFPLSLFSLSLSLSLSLGEYLGFNHFYFFYFFGMSGIVSL